MAVIVLCDMMLVMRDTLLILLLDEHPSGYTYTCASEVTVNSVYWMYSPCADQKPKSIILSRPRGIFGTLKLMGDGACVGTKTEHNTRDNAEVLLNSL